MPDRARSPFDAQKDAQKNAHAGRSFGIRLSLAAAPVVGIGLRLWTLPGQILGDDETHAIRAALDLPLRELLVSYRMQDHSIPLTALYRIAMDAGVVLSEMHFRAPILVSAALLLVLAPRWVANRCGAPTASVFAWLLALSPMLFFYARIVRSYAPIVLLGAAAAVAFLAWWQRGRTRDAVAYCACAALAAWFHLAAIPFVLSPLLFGLLSLALDRSATQWRPSWVRLAVVGCGVALGFACFMVPARESLAALIAAKRVAAITLQPGILFELLGLQAGTGSVAVALAFWLLALFGLRSLLRSDRPLALYSLTLVLGQFVGLTLLSPDFHSVVLLNRWVLIVLPVVLLWVALGVERARVVLRARPGWSARVGAYGPAFVVAGLFVSGPLANAELWRSSFQHHYDWIRFTAPLAEIEDAATPAPVRALDGLAPGALLEYPWHPFWGFNRSFYAHQRRHGRRVLVSHPEPFARDPRLRWRNFAALDPARVLQSDARYLLVHLDLPREERAARESLGEAGRIRVPETSFLILRDLGARGARRMIDHFGPPLTQGDDVLIWDLDALRAGG